jgi:hypothetical protein
VGFGGDVVEDVVGVEGVAPSFLVVGFKEDEFEVV